MNIKSSHNLLNNSSLQMLFFFVRVIIMCEINYEISYQQFFTKNGNLLINKKNQIKIAIGKGN
jgi:hypothetical protein